MSRTLTAKDLESIRFIIYALDNRYRWKILEKLKMKENNSGKDSYIENYSMNTNEIYEYFREKDMKTTVQNIVQHLQILRKAGLVNRRKVYYDENGVRVTSPIYAYYLNNDAFDELFLGVNFFRDKVKSLVGLEKESNESKKYSDGVISVVNGEDERKILMINENETAFIGRKSLTYQEEDDNSVSLELSNSYTTVSSINKPHLKIYNKRGTWYMKDESSTNGTYCSNVKLKRGFEKEIPNNSLIKLSKGPGSALLYFTYN